MRARRVRGVGPRAISSIYGAFAVVLVSVVVVGAALNGIQPPAPRSAGDARLADLFLDTLLKSNIANGTSLRGALESACFAVHCPTGSWNASRLARAVTDLAFPLSHALDRQFSITAIHEGLVEVRVGDLGPGAPGTASRAEVYQPREHAFVAVTAVIGLA